MLKMDDRSLYTPAEAQSILRISRPTFYRRVEDGSLEVVRVGAALRVRDRVLRAAIENGLPREKQVAG